MSKREAHQFKTRWKVVNEFIADEISNTPIQVRVDQLRTVFNSARFFTNTASPEEVAEVRSRWILLKAKLDA
jgi:hypothetical protein